MANTISRISRNKIVILISLRLSFQKHQSIIFKSEVLNYDMNEHLAITIWEF